MVASNSQKKRKAARRNARGGRADAPQTRERRERPRSGAPEPARNAGGRNGRNAAGGRNGRPGFGMTVHGEFTVVITQLVAYALFFGIIYTLGVRTPGGIMGSGMLAMSAAMLLIVGWPFGGDESQAIFGRAVAAVTFVVSAIVVLPSEFYTDMTYIRWAAYLVVAAALVVAASFLWTNLQRGKGKDADYTRIGVTAGFTALCDASWIFLPAMYSDMSKPEAASSVGWAVFVVLVVAAVVLLRVSTKRWNALEEPGAYAWLGMGMVPVMWFGLAVFLASCATNWLL
ncbi:hypothetical protein [Bifidobacterium parmae]|uniref:Uncharacterized protein n=1 Tax=Bifidobacterium parmae TaxID=361854 RepID=A0A2N5J095_9BIFI|nr:hypothetical protein [Bifidobacterium parmae]PLS27638.1 hypothetical protein Uis4E_1483 [Bifidobacterium parmae]